MYDPTDKGGGNSCNDKRSKTDLTDVDPVEVAVPRATVRAPSR
ncbi:hypothetical protein SUDANB150_07579 [Streptomyces sp. enrichment culture]